jgi:hypothetical protein
MPTPRPGRPRFKQAAQTAAILLVITLAAGLYVVDASADMILRLSPLLAWFWIVGCGFVIAFPVHPA